jgi:hypothetical protein
MHIHVQVPEIRGHLADELAFLLGERGVTDDNIASEVPRADAVLCLMLLR